MAVYKDKKTGTWYAHGKAKDSFGRIKWYTKRNFKNKSSAKKWEEQYRNELVNKTDNLSFGELAELYFKNLKNRVKESSYKNLRYKYKECIAPYWKDVKLSLIKYSLIIKWQELLITTQYTKNHELHSYSNIYLDRIQSLFKTIIKHGISMGYINDSSLLLFKSIKNPNELKKEMLFWEPDEFKKFIKVIDDVEYKAFFYVLYMCGLRMGEACALNWNDIDFTKKTIKIEKSYSNHTQKITTPKTSNSYRSVIMPNSCFEAVKELYLYSSKCVGFNQNCYVFGYDKPLDDNTIRRRKNYYVKLANVKNIRIHDFRHSHVSLLINQGCDPYDISKRLGHTVEMVTNVYAHWFDNSQQEMVNKLNKLDI